MFKMVAAKAIIFDIEGTICPISFVKDVLFPYAVDKIKILVNELPPGTFPLATATTNTSTNPLIRDYLSQFPEEYTTDATTLLDHIYDLIKRDIKASYLKSLQGYLWKSGYDSGEIKAPIYADAITNITKWAETTPIYIYSSGSVAAQILLFKHVEPDLDLTPYLKGYFDTVNAGQKTIPQSYNKIATTIQTAPSDILFFTDNPKEIDAAQTAGWQTTLVVRTGNAPFPDSYKTKTTIITSLDQVQ